MPSVTAEYTRRLSESIHMETNELSNLISSQPGGGAILDPMISLAGANLAL